MIGVLAVASMAGMCRDRRRATGLAFTLVEISDDE